MLGCLMSLRILISLVTLSTSASSVILSFSRILTATYKMIVKIVFITFSSVKIWVPSLTLPKVPSPIAFPKI